MLRFRRERENVKKFGGSVEGPYYPQSNDLLYIFHVDSYEWLNKAGRVFLKRVQEEGINITPMRYEVAVTPKEFWGK